MNRYRLENIEVVDGDTIKATIITAKDRPWYNRKIRFLGIGPCEIRVNKRWTKGLTVTEIRDKLIKGLKAKAKVKELIESATFVDLESWLEMDSFGRILGIPIVAMGRDRIDVNMALLNENLAKVR